MSRTPAPFRPNIEILEMRDNPSGWTGENFDSLAVPALPADWSSWSNTGDQQFITSQLASKSGTNSLASLGSTPISSRLWHAETVSGDTGAAFSVRGGTSAKMDVLTRGTNLETAAPTYLSAEISGSRSFELFEVKNGATVSLGKVVSVESLTGKWIRVSLKPVGDSVSVVVQRLDSGAYLRSNGAWQAVETEAMRAKTTLASVESSIGLGRRSGGSGMAFVDDFALIAPPATIQNFDALNRGNLPTTWRTWSNTQAVPFAVDGAKSQSPNQSVVSAGGSTTASRAWVASESAADTSVAASVFADSLIPAGVVVRGSQLDTLTPTYYSLTVTRGLTIQLKATVAGTETILGTVRSASYVSGVWIRVQLVANGSTLKSLVFRADTNQWLTAAGTWSNSVASALSITDIRISSGGFAGVERARAVSGNVWLDNFETRSSTGIDTGSTGSPGGPVLPSEIPPGSSSTPRSPGVRKYSHIRLSQLAYSGNPAGEYELNLAKTSLDLIIPNPQYLQAFETAAADTTKVIYTNLSNIYGSLLTDWNAYADANRVSRETAFYHVAQATAFTGASPSSQPVNQLWNVQRVNTAGTGTPLDLTAQARGTRSGGVPFGGSGTSLVLGYPERFRELNATLTTPATGNWTGEFEYVSAVNADGTPAAWKTLNLLTDGTGNLRNSGAISFDPPADWVASAGAGGGQRLMSIRIRTTSGTAAQAPLAATILGRDYVAANGRAEGTIPAFDPTADVNGDGYLSDAEYLNRKAGFDARFEYESRLFYPFYGQMRFAVNPSSTAIKNWNVDYNTRLLVQNPLADGLFLDNSHGKLPFPGSDVKEATNNFTQDYANLVGAITKAIAPKWTVSNTAGSIAQGDPVAKNSTAAFEEFVLRPNSSNWAQFRDVADLINRRLNADSPSPYVILDTHSGNLPTNDPRSQISSLAYYYLLADPDKTFLMFNGGQSPAAAWNQVFVPAATVNIGKPSAAYTTWATGIDPENARLTYQVLRREYTNAVTLYKPLSYTLGVGSGTRNDATATVHQLAGNYRKLNADGTLGTVITSLSLRGGEGVVLMKA